MCEYCGTDPECRHPVCSQPGSRACACSLSGPERCPTCGHGCAPWYFGLGLPDAPPRVQDFLGSAESESPGFDRYPATKAELVAAARQSLSEDEEPDYSVLDWLEQRLPSATYRDPGEVFLALASPLPEPNVDASRWYHALQGSAVPLGTRLKVPPDATALLMSRNAEPCDTFSPGDYVLNRESAPLAATHSRPPAPGFAHALLEVNVTFYSTREREGRLEMALRMKDGSPFYVTATTRFAMRDPAKFRRYLAHTSPAENATADSILSMLAQRELVPWATSQEGSTLSKDPSTLEGTLRRMLEMAGYTAPSIKIEYAGTDPMAAAFSSRESPMARMPPDLQAMVKARMEEAMRRAPGRAPSSPGPTASRPGARPPAPSLPPGSGTVVCAKCSAPNPPAGKFCQNCGAPLSSKRLCSKCGHELLPSVKFCGNCGASTPL